MCVTQKILINNYNSYGSQEYDYTYDLNGNLIKTNLDGELYEEYKYNEQGTLIYISNRWGEEKSYVKYNQKEPK